MKKLLVLFIVFSFVPTFVSAQSSYDYDYDWQTGNSITTSRDLLGNTRQRGINTRTGSTWSTTTDATTGRSRGLDSNGNAWSYNPQSGFYSNSSGVVCTGKGAGRICTGQ